MIGSKNVRFALAVTLVFALGASAVSGEEHLLRWKFKEGDVLSFKTVEIRTQEQMGVKVTSEQVQFVDWMVQKVDGDQVTLGMKVNRIQASSKSSSGGGTSFDSEKDKENKDPANAQYKILIGKIITVTMNTKGNVLGVKGYTEIGKEFFKFLEESGGGKDLGPMRKLFESMLSDEFMRNTMDQLITMFPDAAIGTGSSWEEKADFSNPMLGKMVSKIQNTLDTVNGNTAMVKLLGNLELVKEPSTGEVDPNDPMAAMRKMLKITSGKLEGFLQFDCEKGLVQKKQQKVSMTMELMGQKFPFVQEQSIELVGFKSQ